METAKFKVGDILVDKKTSTRYRIIFVSGTQVIVCQMDCNKLNLLDFDIAIIESLLDTLDLTIANEEVKIESYCSRHAAGTMRQAGCRYVQQRQCRIFVVGMLRLW